MVCVLFPRLFILIIQSVGFWRDIRVILSLLSASLSLCLKVLLCKHSHNLLGKELYRGAKQGPHQSPIVLGTPGPGAMLPTMPP